MFNNGYGRHMFNNGIFEKYLINTDGRKKHINYSWYCVLLYSVSSQSFALIQIMKLNISTTFFFLLLYIV